MPVRDHMLRSIRISKGYSIRKLSRLSGVSAALISDLEKGHRKTTTIDTLCALAKAQECSVEDLYYCN
jgi:transcriptional regulator with XRE-family HTH domain